jgi:hypothetical protein
VTETASKFIALYLKANNPNSKPEQCARFAERLSLFINECSLAGYLKENANVLASTPRGSGIKAVRGLSDKEDDSARTTYLKKASMFEMLCRQNQENLEERYLNP